MIINFYLKTFDTDGVYGEWQSITDYVDANKVGDISQKIDGNDFDIGVRLTDSVSITLNNSQGYFSDSTNIKSLFVYKRYGSLVKITVTDLFDYPICGMAICGKAKLGGDELELFEGIVDDSGYSENIKDLQITFRLLGKESVFSQVLAPYSSMSNGQTVSTIINLCLNQTKITDILTIGTITPNNNIAIDNITPFENKTVKDVLNELLILSNSVLIIDDNTIKVVNRTPTTTVQYEFYGQASNLGLENIADISDYSNGVSRTFNFWTWANVTGLSINEVSSVEDYGIRKKELSYESVTNYSKQSNILNNLNDEFGTPKTEFNLVTPALEATMNLRLLDKVKIDYPIVYKTAFNRDFPIWGISKWKEFIWPIGEYVLSIEYSREFKIISKKINLKSGKVEYRIREV